MNKKDADRIADFVWSRLLGLYAEETVGCNHMDWNAFNEWLLSCDIAEESEKPVREDYVNKDRRLGASSH